MSLVVVLATPLVGAILLVVARGIAARVLHLLATVLTAAAAGAVAVQVSHAGSIVALGGLFRADGLSAWMIGLIALVSLLAAIEAPYTVPSAAVGRFRPLFHLFVFTMLLAVATDDVGLMWVAIEGTTLASVFLVNLERSRASLEAAYKYLLICSVGVAIAFIGTVLVYFADIHQFGHEAHALRWTTLVRLAPGLPPRVVELGFVFLLVGYGTKAGLAPMHTWLPDAHSEAPAPISAMMSGCLLPVALYAILRFKVVVDACVGAAFTDRMLILIAVLSVLVAALLLVRQANYKRMLAYSSVEHIGLMCLGSGLGPLGVTASLLHAVTHAAGKSMAFLLSGAVRERYGTSRIGSVRGLLRAMPWTGALFAASVLALLGLPPSGVFVSEMMLVRAGFRAGRPWVTAAVLVLLVGIFIAVLSHLNRMLYGEPPEPLRGRDHPRRLLPLSLNVAVLIALGFGVPGPLMRLLGRAAEIVAP